ncbi:hypothetical protein [Aeromicrobium sp. Sec7.5]|uniref:hypothetical protein n=1 Tax=Aeromicrobium sp. Sec7.5 TaxID=3121276 RepID=UPI002FE4F02C
MLSVSEFAGAVGLSVARARQLAAGGQVRAEKVGSQWVIADGEVNRWRALPSRPMSERVAWAAVAMADGLSVDGLESSERSRLRRRLSSLAESSDPVAQAQAWMRSRGDVSWWHADAESLPGLAERVRLSGVANPSAGLSSGGLVEGYLLPGELKSLVDEFWLVPADPGSGEVVVRVSSFVRDRAPRLMVVADLADHRRPREIAAAERIIREVLEERLW